MKDLNSVTNLLDDMLGMPSDSVTAKAQLVSDRDRLQRRSAAIRYEIKQIEDRLRYLHGAHGAVTAGLASLQAALIELDAEDVPALPVAAE